jgi:hypothetical protein
MVTNILSGGWVALEGEVVSSSISRRQISVKRRFRMLIFSPQAPTYELGVSMWLPNDFATNRPISEGDNGFSM